MNYKITSIVISGSTTTQENTITLIRSMYVLMVSKNGVSCHWDVFIWQGILLSLLIRLSRSLKELNLIISGHVLDDEKALIFPESLPQVPPLILIHPWRAED